MMKNPICAFSKKKQSNSRFCSLILPYIKGTYLRHMFICDSHEMIKCPVMTCNDKFLRHNVTAANGHLLKHKEERPVQHYHCRPCGTFMQVFTTLTPSSIFEHPCYNNNYFFYNLIYYYLSLLHPFDFQRRFSMDAAHEDMSSCFRGMYYVTFISTGCKITHIYT